MALHVTNPSFADRAGNQLREPWVAEKQPSPRRDSIRDVEKFFREEFGKIVEDIAFEQFRVKCCDSVDRMTAYAGKIRHSNGFHACFVDQRKPGNPSIISPTLLPHILQESPVDFENDLQMSRQKARKQGKRPFLKS